MSIFVICVPNSLRPLVFSQVDVSTSVASTESYHCRSVRTMRLSQVDPSVTIGFLVRSEDAFEGEAYASIECCVCCAQPEGQPYAATSWRCDVLR
jgi:hypothetical protein